MNWYDILKAWMTGQGNKILLPYKYNEKPVTDMIERYALTHYNRLMRRQYLPLHRWFNKTLLIHKPARLEYELCWWLHGHLTLFFVFRESESTGKDHLLLNLKEDYALIFQIVEHENCLDVYVGPTKFNLSKLDSGYTFKLETGLYLQARYWLYSTVPLSWKLVISFS